MLIELVYSDPHNNTPYNGQFDSIIKKAKEETNLLDTLLSVLGYEGEKQLSALSDSFVRRFPYTTLSGSEFK